MLSGFPASSTTDPDMQIRAYLMASGGIEPEALARAAGRFMRGEVAGHNNAFAPSCAEFAEECRFQQMSIAAERRPRLEKPETKDDGPKVDPRKLQLLQDALNGSQAAKKELARMFPDNPIIVSAAQEEQKDAAE
ncbi:hypothetical protein RJJ65_32190 [Rhizobium hidalgonense]|uniref:Uncharacterized protein n=1 Tax=Rhizobium hidalgonense TaxID=1538159 RepID=A0AAJ2H1E2_9HYPH|nr:hypothetical protein [Rhizobium hidalgonense]MDR9777219.1 hypothetical protein [Rhizobium hidalgonense]